MKYIRPLRLVPLLAAALVAAPVGAAPARRGPAPIQLSYHGGPLLEHVQVATLYWGPSWKTGTLSSYFDSFFTELFADGRFMSNLAQYDAGGYQISDGTLAGSTTDDQGPPSRVQDSEIRDEIRAQIAAGNLPQTTQDTV